MLARTTLEWWRLPLKACKPRPKPMSQAVEVEIAGSYGDNQVVDGLIIRDIQAVAATINQHLNYEPSSSLVAVHEAVVAYHAVKEGGCLVGERAMIA